MAMRVSKNRAPRLPRVRDVQSDGDVHRCREQNSRCDGSSALEMSHESGAARGLPHQISEYAAKRLPMPVLALGARDGVGDALRATVATIGDRVKGGVNRRRLRALSARGVPRRARRRHPRLLARGILRDGASGLGARSLACPLSGVKRTWLRHTEMSASDPKRTLVSGIGPIV